MHVVDVSDKRLIPVVKYISIAHSISAAAVTTRIYKFTALSAAISANWKSTSITRTR